MNKIKGVSRVSSYGSILGIIDPMIVLEYDSGKSLSLRVVTLKLNKMAEEGNHLSQKKNWSRIEKRPKKKKTLYLKVEKLIKASIILHYL